MSIEQSISQFCAVSRDELLLEQRCQTQAQQFKTTLQACQEVLGRYWDQQSSTSAPSFIPLTLQDQGEPRQVYLRRLQKTTYKAVNETALQSVVEQLPTAEDLQRVATSLGTPDVTLGDVYAAWVFERLKTHNVVHRTSLELSDRKPRVPKGEPRSETATTTPPDPALLEAASQWLQTQRNLQRLREFKKTHFHRLAEERQAVEPVLNSYLASRPPDQQEQKVTMMVQGESRPFYVKRVTERKLPTLTLPKSQPLILQTLRTIFPSSEPFDVSVATELLRRSASLPNVILSTFRTHWETYKTEHTHISTHVTLKEKKVRAKRARSTEDTGAPASRSRQRLSPVEDDE